MQYINKAKNAKEGYKIVDRLRAAAWNDDEKKYIGFNYGGLSADPYRSELKTLTLQEQNHYCCYCMRKINHSDSNLEHIIPQNPKDDDFEKYLKTCSDFEKKVIHKNNEAELNIQLNLETLEKYPHDIAYHNLISSCVSKEHCNSKRKNFYIEPIMYYENIENIIIYEPIGSIYGETLNPFLIILGLNEDGLTKIRRLWRLFAKNNLDSSDIMSIPINELNDRIYDAITSTMVNSSERSDLIKKFVTQGGEVIEKPLSKVFRKYSWFFNYYKNKYP